MEKIWKDQYQVSWDDADMMGKAQLSAICNYLQLSAGNQAIDMGFGYDDVLAKNQVWVIVGLLLKMERYPGWRDMVFVETWPKGIDRLIAFRDFRIFDEQGRKIGAATSSWMILDIESRRPKPVDIVKDKMHLALPENALDKNPHMIRDTGPLNERYVHTARYSEIDFNGHVNNTRYVDWAMDAFDIGRIHNEEVDTLLINFLAEARAGQQFGIAANNWNGKENLIQGTRLHDNKPAFRTSIRWK